jgi:cytochrome c-type biogenesis protein CcmH/NrfF
MSPFCPGRTLYDCPSPNAADWRRDIEAMLLSGKSPEEIQTVLAGRVEEDLSGSPNAHASYLWSLVFLFVAVLGLALLFRRLRPRKTSPGSSLPQPDLRGVDDSRLDEELDGVK